MDRRKKRTSTNQYLLYIDMMEKDPIFASGKVPRDVDLGYLTKKWKELSDKLNACGNGPTLTAEEWRKRLNDWKNTTRCKYRRSISGEKDISMTNLELKALELFGKVPNLSTEQMMQLKSEKDEGEDDEHQGASESFHKELQAAVEEAIGGEDEEDGMVEEHVDQEEELLEETLNTSVNAAATSVIDPISATSDSSAYRTIVVDNSNYVDDEHPEEQVEYIPARRNTVTAAPTNVQTVVTSAPQATAKLINGGIPIKRLRTQTRGEIVYEVKSTRVPQTHTQRTFTTTIQATSPPTPIALHQSKVQLEPPSQLFDTQDAREIAHQLKRVADIKYEKLKFEIARFKFNNPGFHYNHPAL